jgi:hypothetical protein
MAPNTPARRVARGRTAGGRVDKNRPRRGGLVFSVAASVAAILLFSIAGAQSPPAVGSDLTSRNLARIDELRPSAPDHFSFAVFGDNRGSTTVIEHLLARVDDDPDILFAVSLGDIIGMGRTDLYERFLGQVERNLTKPVAFVVGNHELMPVGKTTRERYALTIGPSGPFYYSFTVGSAYFIAVDNAWDADLDGPQEEWLRAELSAAQGCKHVFVFMHRPPYDPRGTGYDHSMGRAPAERLMDILSRYRVTYIFCSHVHGYFAGAWGSIPYVVSGGAGAPLIGTDPAGATGGRYYFNHYLKVTVTGKSVTIEPVEVK